MAFWPAPIRNQGAYLHWNRSGGDGETWLLNQRGGGGGGIRFGAATTGNVATEWARFDGSGQLGLGATAPATTLDVRTPDASAAITVGKTDATAGALFLGNANHGLKRNYNGGGNDVGLFTTSGNVYLSTAGNASTSQLALLNNGNVGIGTSSPGQKLEVAGGVYANGEGTGFLTDNGASARVGLIKYGGREGGIWRTSAQDFEIGRVNAAVTALPGSPTTWTTDLYVGSTGNVGIGTTSPGVPLDVQSGVSTSLSNYGYLNGSGTAGFNGPTATAPVSIRASGRIVASEFNAVSDARLKSICGLSDNATDLGLLTQS